MQLPIIGMEKKKRASGGNAVSGIWRESFRQPFSGVNQEMGGWVRALAHSPGEEGRGNVAPRVLGVRNTSEFGFISVKKTDFNCRKCSSTGTGDGFLSSKK